MNIQPYNVNVLTDIGWKSIGDITEYDKIVDKIGNVNQCKSIEKEISKHCYRIKFDDNSTIDVGCDCLITVIDPTSIKAKKIKVTDLINCYSDYYISNPSIPCFFDNLSDWMFADCDKTAKQIVDYITNRCDDKDRANYIIDRIRHYELQLSNIRRAIFISRLIKYYGGAIGADIDNARSLTIDARNADIRIVKTIIAIARSIGIKVVDQFDHITFPLNEVNVSIIDDDVMFWLPNHGLIDGVDDFEVYNADYKIQALKTIVGIEDIGIRKCVALGVDSYITNQYNVIG